MESLTSISFLKPNKKTKIAEKLKNRFLFWHFSFRITQILKMLDKELKLRYDRNMKSIFSETKTFRWCTLFVLVIG